MKVDLLPDIKGFQQTTLIDWEGKIASIIFLGGCNFKCGFCHSGNLALKPETLKSTSFEDIALFLKSKKGWIEGVVVTGGEPTVHQERLINLLNAIKDLGFLVKLDTNGTNYKLLKDIVDSRLVDYIALDVKAPLRSNAYSRATGVDLEIEDIISSKDLIVNSDIEHECRTTIVPGLITPKDIAEIAKSIIPAKKYCIQQFVPRQTLDPSLSKLKPYPIEELDNMAKLASEDLANVIIRKN